MNRERKEGKGEDETTSEIILSWESENRFPTWYLVSPSTKVR